jgi:glucokinase
MLGAIDIGGTKIAIGIIDFSGRVIARQEYPSSPVPDAPTGIRRMATTLLELQAETHLPLDGIGIGITGPVNPLTGILGKNEFLAKWTGANLTGELAEILHIPVAIENDADAAALGESRWGAGRGSSRFIYLTISTGIGGGVILDGKLYRGVDQAHPEMGHHVIDPSGPKCFCGASGCWESMASGSAMASWFKLNAPPGYPLPEKLDAGVICSLAEQGDSFARQAVDREGFYLGTGLANLIGIFTPEVIALGGGVMKSWLLFAGQAGQVIRRNCGLVPYQKTRVIQASLGIDAGLVGAASVWLHRYGGGHLPV